MSDQFRRGVPIRKPRSVVDFRKQPEYILELETSEVSEVVMSSANVLILAPPGSVLVIRLKEK